VVVGSPGEAQQGTVKIFLRYNRAWNSTQKLSTSVLSKNNALNDHPIFIEALANIVADHLTKKDLTTTQLQLRYAHCVNPYCEEMRNYFTIHKNKHEKTGKFL